MKHVMMIHFIVFEYLLKEWRPNILLLLLLLLLLCKKLLNIVTRIITSGFYIEPVCSKMFSRTVSYFPSPNFESLNSRSIIVLIKTTSFSFRDKYVSIEVLIYILSLIKMFIQRLSAAVYQNWHQQPTIQFPLPVLHHQEKITRNWWLEGGSTMKIFEQRPRNLNCKLLSKVS